MYRRAGFGLVAAGAIALACACGASGDTASDASTSGSTGGDDGGSGSGDDGGHGSDDGGGSGDGSPTNDAPSDAPAVCESGERRCLDHATSHVCIGGQWVDTPCTGGEGCVLGACLANNCTDECVLGDVQGNKTCTLIDVSTGNAATPAPDTDLHDRARGLDAWLRKWGMTYGGVGNARFSDTNYTTVVSMNGIGDSSIWTGTYLASESFRYLTTRSSDARDNVRALVKTLHTWFNVEGDPGVLSRFAAPAGQRPTYDLGGDVTCGNSDVHCNVPYGGSSWDFKGHISRDQYQGVMLGFTQAYQALGAEDEDARALIRADVVALVKELMKDRQVPVNIVVDGVPISQTMTMRFVVLVSKEMTNGKVTLTLDTSNTSDATMTGFQEFTPDLADLVKQVPGLSGSPAIPRASSAIMLASFFRAALLVTDGVPGAQADHDAILDYYLHHAGTGGNVTDWLNVAKTFSDSNSCGQSYYGNNITMEPLYDLSQLETDPTLLATIRNDVMQAKIWPAFVNTKNVFFSFIYAGGYPSYDPAVVTSAAAQLGQFPVAPRVKFAIDWSASGKYPNHQSGCNSQVDHATAIDVGDRSPDDFIWQRDPWELIAGGDLQQTYPGVDFMVAYWMGRKHGFFTERSANRCLAWK